MQVRRLEATGLTHRCNHFSETGEVENSGNRIVVIRRGAKHNSGVTGVYLLRDLGDKLSLSKASVYWPGSVESHCHSNTIGSPRPFSP